MATMATCSATITSVFYVQQPQLSRDLGLQTALASEKTILASDIAVTVKTTIPTSNDLPPPPETTTLINTTTHPVTTGFSNTTLLHHYSRSINTSACKQPYMWEVSAHGQTKISGMGVVI